MKEILLICDGSCLRNPGPGGWCSLLRAGNDEKILTGGHPATTNNRMELVAAIEGLRALKEPSRVLVVTDSEYLTKGMTMYLPRWRTNDWRSASGKPVLNQDLWHQLEQLVERHQVHWSWTRGHDDHGDQKRVDKLAIQCAREQAALVEPK